MKHRLLLVDDDLLHLDSTKEFLELRGFEIDASPTAETALQKLKSSPFSYSLILLDYHLKDKDGASTIAALTQINPNIFILILSGDSSPEAKLASYRCGARGFIDKGQGAMGFLAEVQRWCIKYEETHQNILAPHSLDENENLIFQIGLRGRSPQMAEIAAKVLKLKHRNGPVLILGDSGTGKELIARAFQATPASPFYTVNCATFSSNPQLLSSLLFGHKKGAFTGATQDKKGILEEAGQGIVFLDEIHTLPMPSQLELLRAIQEMKVLPLGTSKEIKVSFRLIAASKTNLLERVEENTFAPDLYYRISRSVITLPHLKERPEDVEPLVRYFCQKWNEENQSAKTVLMRTIPYLENYAWPGNVRELENTIYHLLDMSDEALIGPEHLDPKFFSKKVTTASETSHSLKEKMDVTERKHLQDTLKVSKTLRDSARKMDVSLTTVLRLLKKHNVDPKGFLTSSRGEA